MTTCSAGANERVSTSATALRVDRSPTGWVAVHTPTGEHRLISASALRAAVVILR